MEDKYFELDKQVSKEVMEDFQDEIVDVICPSCKGAGCDHCNQAGRYQMEF